MREMIDYKNNYSEKKNYFVKWGGGEICIEILQWGGTG